MYTVPTIKEIIDLTAQSEFDRNSKDAFSMLWLYLGDFLDFFYSSRRTTDERQRLVEEEPDRHTVIPETTYAFIAGAVHKICSDYSVPVPKWTFNDIYFLKEPYFSLNAKGNLRVSLLAESPVQFRARHIFTSANTLERV